MARDFASKRQPEPERSRVPGWVWVFTTLTAVAFVGFLYYLTQIPSDGSSGADAVRKEVQNLTQQPKTQSEPKPEQNTEPKTSDDTTRSLEQAFEFYKLLKDDEVPVILPEPKTPGADQPGTDAPKTTVPEGGKRWIIQVASFSQVADADRLRAELIINGLTETHLATVELGDRGTYHRVMVGPFENRSRLNKAQDILVGLNHEVMVRSLD
ncbi:SPOR domain-containing protein [Saccharospirillum salsuginis]|uniref:SPOR domain-containing protein n=1 Tax=Saccharospirillum salsuginis TaxID=418750 RepID=A0A918K281_9GAMM|nr:SPOR domain-containing protein [Saccharospirillum salsuginis]GGX44427.1 hypothetical protein GCM10007392_09020 [Saccharospirillum salsuginis]